MRTGEQKPLGGIADFEFPPGLFHLIGIGGRVTHGIPVLLDHPSHVGVENFGPRHTMPCGDKPQCLGVLVQHDEVAADRGLPPFVERTVLGIKQGILQHLPTGQVVDVGVEELRNVRLERLGIHDARRHERPERAVGQRHRFDVTLFVHSARTVGDEWILPSSGTVEGGVLAQHDGTAVLALLEDSPSRQRNSGVEFAVVVVMRQR